MNSSEEKILRDNIRQMIRVVKERKAAKPRLEEKKLKDIIRKIAAVESHQMNEETKLRNIIRQFIGAEMKLLSERAVPDTKPTPNNSTGINVLEDLLKKIVPVLEDDYRLMTTSVEQRESFRAHIVKAAINALTPADVNTEAGDEPIEAEEEGELEVEPLEEDIDIEIEPSEGDGEKFIDIRADSEKDDEEKEEEEEDLSPEEEFGEGLEEYDETGRNIAFNTFNKIETSVIDAYELLGNEEDQELFYDYLIANLKLYFDKFEDELSPTVEEPTNQAYIDAEAAADEGASPEELPPTEGELPPLEEVIVWDV